MPTSAAAELCKSFHSPAASVSLSLTSGILPSAPAGPAARFARRPWAVGPAGACGAGRCRDGASLHRRGMGAIPRAPPADLSACAAPPRGELKSRDALISRHSLRPDHCWAPPHWHGRSRATATMADFLTVSSTRSSVAGRLACGFSPPLDAADAAGISPQGERKGCARAPHAMDGDRRAPQAAAYPRSGRVRRGTFLWPTFFQKKVARSAAAERNRAAYESVRIADERKLGS